jgi:hypothetical protein
MGKSTTKVIRFQIILYRKYSNDWALELSSAFPVPPLLNLVSSHKAAARLGRHGSWMDDGKPEVIDCSVGLVPTKRFSSDRPSTGEKPTSPD